jgi:hypothetical protein
MKTILLLSIWAQSQPRTDVYKPELVSDKAGYRPENEDSEDRVLKGFTCHLFRASCSRKDAPHYCTLRQVYVAVHPA